MLNYKHKELLPKNHKCRLCNRGIEETTFRWGYKRTTGELTKPHTICSECAHNRKRKRDIKRSKSSVKEKIASYFRENYSTKN